MNHHEIEKCVIRAKAGNSEDLLMIIEQYKPFIFKTAREFNIRGCDVYDLAQIGYITLINAVAKYRIGSHTFSSYAFNAIKNSFRYTARQNHRFGDELSLNAPVEMDGSIGTEFIDCIESLENIEEAIIHFENSKELKRAVSNLPEDELELVIMLYYSKVSIKIYAEKKGLTYIQAVRKKNKVLEKLGHSMEK
jgi:RNA polymerase sporulation-specific sigma factor